MRFNYTTSSNTSGPAGVALTISLPDTGRSGRGVTPPGLASYLHDQVPGSWPLSSLISPVLPDHVTYARHAMPKCTLLLPLVLRPPLPRHHYHHHSRVKPTEGRRLRMRGLRAHVKEKG